MLSLAGAMALSACLAHAESGPPPMLAKVHTIQGDETLPEVARANGLGYVEILAANPGINPFVPGVGTTILLPTTHLLPRTEQAEIVVNVSDMRLYWAQKDGSIRTFPIGVGREELTTPPGIAKIVKKVEGPTWYPTPRMRRENPALPAAVPPGPDNPLGTHALYLNRDLLRIHGTDKPWGIGSRTSSGCIRMYPEDIPVLYAAIPTGTSVKIVEQEIKAQWLQGALYLEVHPSPVQADAIEYRKPFDAAPPTNLEETIIAVAAEYPGPVVIDWETVRQAGLERRGVPVRVAVPEETGSGGRLALGAIY